jgi:hypothetical protein
MFTKRKIKLLAHIVVSLAFIVPIIMEIPFIYARASRLTAIAVFTMCCMIIGIIVIDYFDNVMDDMKK